VDEALFLQQQRELQRDYQLRQLLLQDQFDHQSRIDSLVVEQRLKQLREQFQEFPELQQHYTQLLLQDRLQRDQEESNLFARAHLQQHEELQRRALAQSQTQTQQNSTSVQGHQQHTPHGHNAQKLPAQSQQASQESSPRGPNAHGAAQTILRDIAADSLAGNAVKRSELEKRVFANPDETGAVTAPAKKRPRAGTEDSSDGDRKKKKKKEKQPKKSNQASSALDELGRAASQVPKQPVAKTPPSAAKSLGKHASGKPSVPIKPATLKPSAQALLDFASGEARRPLPKTPIMGPPPPETTARGNLEDLLNAAESSNKTDEAASVLTGIKKNAEWSDDEGEDGSEAERKRAIKRGDNIELPNFVSILPQLPQEPEVLVSTGIPGKTKRKKHKGLLDDDSVEKSAGKTKTEKKEAKEGPGQPKLADPAVVEVTYPVDTWWPNAASIREEKKSNGEPLDEEIYDKDEDVLGSEFPFKANLPRIKERFAQDVKPGVLEKVPHCRIHQLAMRKRKFPPVPELVHCFQVTEIYPNDMMVCCSHCGTWRHTACGGHYKPFSVRECIDSPFTAVCDRCHAEEKILRDYPTAKKRIDRQRSEQIRRGLATSAAMRQASFSKHGGTYKWPLGSVSATHIGGHTRSVHTRHDKAEKQWQDMASRLNRIYGYRPKERVKVRTKELERLLVSVEDAGKRTNT